MLKKSSTSVLPNDHRSMALNTFIQDLIQAEGELCNLKLADHSVDGEHKVSYASNNEHEKNSGSVSQISSQAKERVSFNHLDNLKNYEDIQHTQNTNMYSDTGSSKNTFHGNNTPLLIKARHSGKSSQNSADTWRNNEYHSDLDGSESDDELLKYLTSNFPKGNRLLQMGQMQEKQTLDTDRLSQMFAAMKKNYFPSTVAVKPDNLNENPSEAKFDQGDEKINQYGNTDLEDTKDYLRNEPRHLSHTDDISTEEKDALEKEPRYFSHLEDEFQDTLRNKPIYGSQLDDKNLYGYNGIQNSVSYLSALDKNVHDWKDPTRNGIRKMDKFESNPLYENAVVHNEPRYARYLKNERHVEHRVAAGKELPSASYHADNLKKRSQPRVRSESTEDQPLDFTYSNQNVNKVSVQDDEDPAVVKYFQTHGQRHNRSPTVDSSRVKYDTNNLDMEEDAEPPDDEKLKQARERLQLEDADGLLIGMHSRIGTTDNQMEKENINQDKVTPKSDEEEDIQQQLEEEKLIFFPFVPGQSPPLPINADENIQFINEHEEKSHVAHQGHFPSNSDSLTHFHQASGKQLQELHSDKTMKTYGQNQELTLENCGAEIGNNNNQDKVDISLSEDGDIEPLTSHSDDVDGSYSYLSPAHRDEHRIYKRSHHIHPQFEHKLIMDDSQEFYPSHNLRHLLTFEGNTNQQSASLDTSMSDSDSINAEALRLFLLSNTKDKSPQSNKSNQANNTMYDINGNRITYLERKSSDLSDANQRHRRAVVKRPGAIWQDEESNEERDEGEEETNREESELGYNELDAQVKRVSSFNPAIRDSTSKDHPKQHLDNSIAFEPTADSTFQLLIPVKRRAEEIENYANVTNYDKQNRKKRCSKNSLTDDTVLHKLTDVLSVHLTDEGNSDNEIQMLGYLKNKESQLNLEKREMGWHSKIKRSAIKYKNDAEMNNQMLFEGNTRDRQVGQDISVSSEEHNTSKIKQSFDPPFRSDAQRIKSSSDENGVDEYNNVEHDSNTYQTAKLSGTNARPLLEKTSKDYEDVSKELKQVMNSLATKENSKQINRENAGNLLNNKFEAKNSVPLEVIKLGSPSLTEESQTKYLVNPLQTNTINAESEEKNSDDLVSYTMQFPNLASHDETEEENNVIREGQPLINQICDERNFLTGTHNADVKEEPDLITHQDVLFNDGYDSFNESPFFGTNDIATLQYDKSHFNNGVKKRSNHLQYSRSIPQDLLDHSVSTRELDRLISEGNLPVLKRVKRSVDGNKIYKRDGEHIIKVYNDKKEISQTLEGLSKIEDGSFAVPDDGDLSKEDVLFENSFRESKHVPVAFHENQDSSENSPHIGEKDIAKTESLNTNKKRDVSPDATHKANIVSFAPIPDVGSNNAPNKEELLGNIQGSSGLVEERGLFKQRSKYKHDNMTPVKNNGQHSLNKRETVYEQTGNVNNFAHKHIVNKLNTNSMSSNNAGRYFNGMRRNVNSDMAHGLRQSRSRDDMSYSHIRGHKGDVYSELPLQKRSDLHDGDLNKKHHKIKPTGEPKDGPYDSFSTLYSSMPVDEQLGDGLLYNIPSQITNEDKSISMKPTSVTQDSAFGNVDTFGNSLLDDVLNTKHFDVHEAELSKNSDILNTFPISSDESNKVKLLTSHDSWNTQGDGLLTHNTMLESDYPSIALANEQLHKSGNDQNLDATSKHSLSDDSMYSLNNEKESPQRYHSTISDTKDDYHNLNEDNGLRANKNRYSHKPYTGTKQLEHSAGKKCSDSHIKGNENQHKQKSSSKLTNQCKASKLKNTNGGLCDHETKIQHSSSKSSHLCPGEYDTFPSFSLNSKTPSKCVSKTSKCEDSIPLFPLADQKHSKSYNGELDDGLLGMNIVDTILNQVYGSKQLQHHIGPGLQRGYMPTKVQRFNSGPLTRTRQKMMSQISTIIDKGLEEEMKENTCVKLPTDLQEFLDWLVNNNSSAPCVHSSTHRVCNPKSKPNARPLCTNGHNKSREHDAIGKKSLLLKKLTEDYEHLSQSDKAVVKNAHDILDAYSTVVNKLQKDLNGDKTKKHGLTKSNISSDQYHARHNSNTIGNFTTSSDSNYNLPIFNFDDSMLISPVENGSLLNLPNNFVLPYSTAALSDLSKLNYMTGDNNVNSYFTQDLDGLGFQDIGDKYTSKDNLFPTIHNSNDGRLRRQKWMQDLETGISDDYSNPSHSFDTDALNLDSELFQGQTSDSRWPSKYSYKTIRSKANDSPRVMRYFNDAGSDDNPLVEHEPNAPLHNNNGAYTDGVFEAPEHSLKPIGQPHVSNDYKRLLARAEQIRRKRSRGEIGKEQSLEQ